MEERLRIPEEFVAVPTLCYEQVLEAAAMLTGELRFTTICDHILHHSFVGLLPTPQEDEQELSIATCPILRSGCVAGRRDSGSGGDHELDTRGQYSHTSSGE